MNLYIYNYNNYYNRQLKRAGNNIEDYVDFLLYGPVQGVYGFTPGDGINTKQLIGSNAQMYDGKGDYLIAHNPDTNEILRWFIIDSNRTRDGQWSLTLRRDLIVDYYDKVLEADCFIEKANLLNTSNFIYNSEDIIVNQIKTEETLLKDESDSAWLTIYYAKDAQDLSGTVDILNEDVDCVPLNVPTIQDWQYYKYTQEDMITDTYDGYYIAKVRGPAVGIIYVYVDYYINSLNGDTSYKNVALIDDNSGNRTLYSNKLISEEAIISEAKYIENAFIEKGLTVFNPSGIIGQASQQDIDYVLSLQGKTVKTENGKYYRISITTKSFTNRTIKITNDSGGLYLSLKNLFEVDLDYKGSPNNNTFLYNFDGTAFRISYIELDNLNVNYDITSGQRLLTEDAPWNICTIPYGNITVKNETNNETIVTTQKEVGLAVAAAIQLQNSGSGATKIYDVQLLPYCPVQSLITDKGEITVSNEAQYSLVKQGDIAKGIIFNVPFSSFSLAIKHKIRRGLKNIETKLNNICDYWRLASPSYASYFDFSVEMNKGIEFFDVDCNYKPFTPYIHVNPNFRGLYGYDDNSPRGLILGGDFSISQIIDQWESYQIQNKNFQLIFDRQKENLQVQHDIQRKQDIWNASLGSVSGAASGAMIGTMIAPGIGTAIGGIIGGAASAAGGIADISYNQQLRDEAKDYMEDMFKLQLGNIQALPQTIGKVGAFNANNKIFPILEYYTCSNEEKIAVLNKISWNGMTVNVIDKLKNYIYNTWQYNFEGNQYQSKNYIKAKLIRIDLETESFNVINSLAGELNKGVYIS